jgi:hypothetical protein
MDDAVMNKYTTLSSEARHYVQYDQGKTAQHFSSIILIELTSNKGGCLDLTGRKYQEDGEIGIKLIFMVYALL